MKLPFQLFSVFILGTSLTSAAEFSFQPRDPELNRRLNETWGLRRESTSAKILKFAPRLVSYEVSEVLEGRVAQRAAKTVKAPAVAFSDGKKGLYEVSDSLLNLPADIHDVVADAGGLVKDISYATGPVSGRLKLCSSNLMNNLMGKLTALQFINPMFHIGVVVDSVLFETTDEYAEEKELRSQRAHDGLVCHDVPLRENVPESVLIEKLICADQVFKQDYNIIKYNCGGYTRDILHLSGLGYPSFINWGIGAEFRAVSNGQSYRENKASAKTFCNHRVEIIRDLLRKIENGESAAQEMALLAPDDLRMSTDLAFQILVSSARNNLSEGLVLGTKGLLSYSEEALQETFLNHGKIRSRYRRLFANLSYGLKEPHLELIEKHHPVAAHILKAGMK